MKKKTFEKKEKHYFNRNEEFDDEVYEEDEDDMDDDDDEVDDDDIDDDEDDEDDEDEYEDDDDDEDDDEDYDEDDDEYYDPVEVKRIKRRNRRIRNQILAYCVLILFVVAIFGGAFLGGRKVYQSIKDKKQEAALAEQLEEMAVDEEEILITEPEEPVEEEEVISPLDEIALAKIAEMPIEDKVAALFMVTPDELTGVEGVTKAGETTQNALEKYKVGGMVYTAGNLKDDEQVKTLLSNTALIDQTLFLAVSEVGGKDAVVASKTKAESAPDAATIGSSGDASQAKEAGSKTGAYLAEYGFNLNIAPSADISVVDGNVLGNNGFGSDPSVVGSMAASYVQGLQEQNVSACVTTFPGLGSVIESTAAGMANTDRTLEDMQANEFTAYKAALDAGAEFMMIGTISASGITGDNTPCCLSKTAVDLVRNELGFDGIIMTGALNEASVTDYHTSKDAAILAIRAGVDVIYMPENFQEAYEGLLAEVQDENGSIDESRIDESLLRIYRVKYKDKVDNLNQ